VGDVLEVAAQIERGAVTVTLEHDGDPRPDSLAVLVPATPLGDPLRVSAREKRTKTLADVRAIVGVNDVVEGDGEELCRRVAQQPAQRRVDGPHASVRRRHTHTDR
jgi:hypothetical protein